MSAIVLAGASLLGERLAFRRAVALVNVCLLAIVGVACGPRAESGVDSAPGVADSPHIIAIGDSQTAGVWLNDPVRESWPARLNDLLCPPGTTCVANVAVGGQPIGTVSPTGPPPLLEVLDAQLASVEEPDIALVLIGQLDLVSTDDVEQILEWYSELEQRLNSAGVDHVYFLTLLPFDTEAHPNPDWIPQLEVRRAAINDGLLARWGPTQQVIDLESALTEQGSTEFRTDLSTQDGNHLSADGSAVVAIEVERRLTGSAGAQLQMRVPSGARS